LNIGDKKIYFCQPGVVGKKMAVQVTGKLADEGADEFEELSVEGDETV
jgi:flagellar motor switch protein FliM